MKGNSLELRKGFESRRAGLAPMDSAADREFLDQLVYVERDSSGPGGLKAPRALTQDERDAVESAGFGLLALHGDVPCADEHQRRASEQKGLARRAAEGLARKAEREAVRLLARVKALRLE